MTISTLAPHPFSLTALHGHAPAVLGAGCDPGALHLVHGLALLLAPKGHTDTRHHAIASLHHTLAARNVPGVRDVLCAELPAPGRGAKRYVYVELSPEAEPAKVAEAIRGDPLFLDEETIVVPVESTAALEAERHGVTLERRGTAAGTAHQRFLVEARFDVHAAAAQVMVGAARALVGAPPGVRTLLDVPLAALVGQRAASALAASA
jgi:diaminopimelate dehydrogenase